MSHNATNAYFSHLTSLFTESQVAVICVAHLVDTALHFLPAVDRMADLALVLPKPNSAQDEIRLNIERRYTVEPLTRSLMADGTRLTTIIDRLVANAERICIMDVGGYFARPLALLSERYGAAFCGIVEGTENGIQRYEALPSLPVPLYSVARSPLKYPENHLVGAGIAFSIEAVLREQGKVLQGLRATVIGYGRIGRAVAHALRGRDLDVAVCDNDPITLAEAAAHGFRITRSTDNAIADATLVVCATGRVALRGHNFAHLRPGAYVASVTSADDELALDELESGYTTAPAGNHITRYRRNQHWFYLINNGNAVNFLHGGVLGTSIHLVEGEKLACLHAVTTHTGPPGSYELTREQRVPVAEVWLQHFNPT